MASRKGKNSAEPKVKVGTEAAQTPTDQLYSVDDAANYLFLSPARVRGLIRQGQLVSEQVPITTDKGKSDRTATRIRRSVLEAFREARKSGGTRATRVGGGISNGKQYIGTLTIEQLEAMKVHSDPFIADWAKSLKPRFQKTAGTVENANGAEPSEPVVEGTHVYTLEEQQAEAALQALIDAEDGTATDEPVAIESEPEVAE